MSKHLPSPRRWSSHRPANEERVKKILAAKNPSTSSRSKSSGMTNTDTSQLEREIDEIVYELYGLTEEERRIVEGA